MNSHSVEFHRETQFVSIFNKRISLRFAVSPPGALVSLAAPRLGLELFDSSLALAASELWRLFLPNAADLSPLGARRALRFDCDFTSQDNGSGLLKMHWEAINSSSGELPLRVNLALLLSPDSYLCSCRISASLPQSIDPAGAALLFPNFSAFDFSKKPDASLFLPLGQGLLLPNPAANLPVATDWLYPGDLTMQFAGLALPARKAAFYLAAHDPKASLKGFRTGTEDDAPFSLGLLNFPAPDASGKLTLNYDIVFGLLPGSWPEAASAYRSWALNQSWLTPRPEGGQRHKAPTKQSAPTLDAPPERNRGLWLITHGDKNRVLPAATKLQRHTNTPVRLLWRWWHGCPGDSLLPDYLPPRDANEPFSKALDQLSEAGISVWLNLDAASASPNSSAWQMHNLKSLASLNSAGKLQPARENPFVSDSLVAICPSGGRFPALLADTSQRLRDLGAVGAWFEHLLPPSAALRCFATDHPHLAGTGDFHSAALADTSCASIATNPPEIFFNLLETCLFSGVSAERSGRPKGFRSDAWEPISLYQAVYSPYLRGLGLLGPLDNLYPRDSRWPDIEEKLRASENAILREEYAGQFLLEAARTLLWGYQPALIGLDPELLRNQSCSRKLALLYAFMQVDAMEPAGTRGEFIGPIAVDSPSIKIDFLVNSPYSQPGSRRVFSREIPAVQATAWRGERGKTLLVVVNLCDRSSDFACTLTNRRLGALASGKINALTFSPELGGKTAHLTLKENYIEGCLPPHSASLIWL